MSGISRAADFAYTVRFIKLLVTPFDDTPAYKLGIIDGNGKRIKTTRINTSAMKSAYTKFHVLTFNLKRLLGNLPAGKTKIASWAAALWLIKENYDINIRTIAEEFGLGKNLAEENSEWFVTSSGMLSPGVYITLSDKMVNESFDLFVKKNDKIMVSEDAYAVGHMFGIAIYEAIHVATSRKIYVTARELKR
jgi:hypothetical protein